MTTDTIRPGRRRAIALGLLALAIVLLLTGTGLGLFVAPPERYMGQVGRILYVHVPTAWVSMVALTLAMVSAVGFLLTRRFGFDDLLEASVEMGVLLSFLLCVQGSLWARPTWGVWWDWDPRLTTVAVMLFAFVGVLALRKFVEDPDRRATWCSVATILAFADVPIVYFSVRWWNSLHQVPSSTKSVDPSMAWPLRINALGMLFLALGLILLRAQLAEWRRRALLAPPPRASTARPSTGLGTSGGTPAETVGGRA